MTLPRALHGLLVLSLAAPLVGHTAPGAVQGSGEARAGSAHAPLDRSISVTLVAAEPAEAISVRYYGGPSEARAILLANGLPAWGRRLPRLPQGKPIRLPTSWSYRIRAGDTWAQLAADYLGDRSRGSFLARLNYKAVEEAAPVGHVIVVPTVIDTAVPRYLRLEKMVALLLDLPERDQRVTTQVEWIRELNGLPPGSTARRATLQLPLPGMRLLGWFVPTALPERDPGTRRRAEHALGEALVDLRKGRYVEALDRLGRLAEGAALDRELLAEHHLARCTALVALGRTALALEAAAAALGARPGWVLDPVQSSPKVRAVFEQAGRGARRRRTAPAPPRPGGRN